jgi:hypothetical protein
MKKMYRLSTNKENQYSFCTIDIVFDKEESYSITDVCNGIEITWQGDNTNNNWYGGKFKIKTQTIELLKIANKVFNLLTKESYGSLNLQPYQVIELLEKAGYKEAQYNPANSNYLPQKEWDNGNIFGVYFTGKTSPECWIITDTEQNAVKKAIEKAGLEISKQRNMEKWIEWLNNPYVKFIEKGREWEDQKSKIVPEVELQKIV